MNASSPGLRNLAARQPAWSAHSIWDIVAHLTAELVYARLVIEGTAPPYGSTWPPIVLHRDLWDLVGGLSIEFSPGMYSDPDLSMKLWQAGVRYFKGLGQSRVYHFGSKSTKRKRMNTGRDLFLMKWGISSSTFTKKHLRRGTPFNGPLTEPELSAFDWWKNFFKRLTYLVRQGWKER